MIILNNDDIRELLDTGFALEAIERSYRQLISGAAVCTLHMGIQIPTKSPDQIYQFGASHGGSANGYFAVRMMSDIRYQRVEGGVRTQEKFCVQPGLYCGLLFLFSVSNGEPLAVLNDGVIQQLRVGVDAALGVKYMAREDAAVLGMFGAGGLARSFVECIRLVRPLKTVRVYDPVTVNRDKFIEEMRARHDLEVLPVSAPEDVYRGADIVAECTNAVDTPVVLGRYVEKGTHILSVGRRLDEGALRSIERSLRFGNATSPSGQPEIDDEHLVYMAPLLAGATQGGESRAFRRGIDAAKTVYLKDLVNGMQGRQSADQITYSERGNIMGLQFHEIAGHVYSLAKQRGFGNEIPTDWFLQDIRN